MTAFIDWLRNHPLGYPAILFVLACIVSIYAGDIKRFVHKWPGKTARAAVRNSTAQQLELLKHLQPGNAYNLLFYFASQFIGFVFQSLGIIVVANIVSAVKYWHISADTYFSLVAGLFCGRCNTVRKLLVQLGRYPESTAELEKRLADLRKPAESTSQRALE